MLYIDDKFPEHPKAVAAGGDACWLWLCAYGYVNRNNTEGYVPKELLPRLSDRKAPTKLAKLLVEVGLWEDKGDSYFMHDYETWNAGALARKEKARRAANKRWNPDAQEDAPSKATSSAQASPEHMPEPCQNMPNHKPQTTSSKSLSQDPVAWPDERRVRGVIETETEVQRASQILWRVVQLLASAGVKNPQIKPAMNFVQWALTYLDANLVDAAIGHCETLDSKPRSVKYLAKVVASWGEQRGVKMPEFA